MKSGARITIVDGDLLDQNVEVIVNAWNRNLIPWWLLIPQGVSGAIKRRAGYQPFRELARHGVIPLGGAVETGAGALPFRSIIHVAGINLVWRSSEAAIRACVRSALEIATGKGYQSIAFPLIGAGTGGYAPDKVVAIMEDEAGKAAYQGEVRIVRFSLLTN
jgi:O-acetyl-ADP-ribose deacetylase